MFLFAKGCGTVLDGPPCSTALTFRESSGLIVRAHSSSVCWSTP